MFNVLIIIKMQIKTTMSYHLTLVRIAIIKTSTMYTILNTGEGVEKRELSYTVGGHAN